MPLHHLRKGLTMDIKLSYIWHQIQPPSPAGWFSTPNMFSVPQPISNFTRQIQFLGKNHFGVSGSGNEVILCIYYISMKNHFLVRHMNIGTVLHAPSHIDFHVISDVLRMVYEAKDSYYNITEVGKRISHLQLSK